MESGPELEQDRNTVQAVELYSNSVNGGKSAID